MTNNLSSASTIKGLKLSNETKCQISIIEGQGMATKQDVVESAIHLLYSIMPNDRNDRQPLSMVVDQAIALIRESNLKENKTEAEESKNKEKE
ncbi:MAG: hypothetical protein Q9M18_00795 [Mariprofundaceae bacterium]|nr:hypothetical protein [Mariprofundaceae bacterium]